MTIDHLTRYRILFNGERYNILDLLTGRELGSYTTQSAASDRLAGLQRSLLRAGGVAR